MSRTTDLVSRKTVVELVADYQKATRLVEQGLDLLKQAQVCFKSFESMGNHAYFSIISYEDRSLDIGPKLKRFKTGAWKYLVDRIELKKYASVARAKAIDDQLNHRPDELPEITVEDIMSWLNAMQEYSPEVVRESILEVYDILRPRGHRGSKLKTNSQFQVKEKVILCGVLDEDRNKFFRDDMYRVRYGWHNELRALDRVMHMLDGVQVSAYRDGDLIDAIEKTKGGVGETEYFGFKCCLNGNLHLLLKRKDLIGQINSIGGGNALPNPDKDKHAMA